MPLLEQRISAYLTFLFVGTISFEWDAILIVGDTVLRINTMVIKIIGSSLDRFCTSSNILS